MALITSCLVALGIAEKAAETLDAAVGKLFGARFSDVLQEMQQRLQAFSGQVPPNHDLERAIRACELGATLMILRQWQADWVAEGLGAGDVRTAPPPPFLGAAETWVLTQLGLCPSLRLEMDAAVVARMEQALDGFLASGQPDAAAAEAVAATEQAVLAALVEGAAAGPAPDAFRDRFLRGSAEKGGLPPWRLCFLGLMREVLKKNQKARDAFLISRTARLAAMLDALLGDQRAMLALLREVREDSAATRGNTEALLAGQARQDVQLDAILAAVRSLGITARAEAEGLAERTILAFARRLRPEEAHDLDSAVRAVEHAVEIALDLIRRGERPASNEDAFVGTVLAEVARRTRAGDLEGGARAVDDGLAELDAREAEQRDALRRARATLLEAGIGQEILRRDAEAAARRVEALVALEAPDRPAWAPAFLPAWNAYDEEGRDKGLNLSLEIAIALARRMLATADTPEERGIAANLLGITLRTLGARESGTVRLVEAVAACRLALKEWTRERVPFHWATAQNSLGNALSTLGARESGTARLEEAVAAYRAALEERTRPREPLLWAETQIGLGATLSELGQRESGTARLEEAVAAYRGALEETTRERAPIAWATMQNNLGNVLRTLGEREGGTTRLEEAVAACHAALEERTRDRVPLDWAVTQNNLGNALLALGARDAGTVRLAEAVAAYRAALEERTRERVPLQWAMTQNNLGNALQLLGEREGGTARLGEAVAAHRAALEEWTRERVPLQWSTVQNNLGNALSKLGARETGTERLEESVTAYRAALEEGTRDRVPLDWARTQNNLGNTLSMLGARETGTERLKEAVAAYRAALEERTRDRVPLGWARTQNNFGNALKTLGEREGGTVRLEEAVAAYRAALEEWRRDRVPLDWAMTQNNLGGALATLGEREGGTARLEEAVAAYRAALEERTRERVPRDWAQSQQNLANGLAALAERRADRAALLAQAVAHMRAAVSGYRQVGDGYWGPNAERRLADLEALLRSA